MKINMSVLHEPVADEDLQEAMEDRGTAPVEGDGKNAQEDMETQDDTDHPEEAEMDETPVKEEKKASSMDAIKAARKKAAEKTAPEKNMLPAGEDPADKPLDGPADKPLDGPLDEPVDAGDLDNIGTAEEEIPVDGSMDAGDLDDIDVEIPSRKKSKKGKKAKKAKKAKKPGKKTVLPWVILGAIIVAGATYGVAIHMQAQILSAYDKGLVYVATSGMVDGHVVTGSEAASLTGQVELPVDAIPQDAVTDLSMIMDAAARYDIQPGTILCASMFEPVNEITAGMREPVIAGFRSEDIYQVVGGVLRPGDTISIYTVDNVAEMGGAVYEGTLRWDNIRVQDVFDSAGARVTNADESTPAARVNIYMEKSEVDDFYAKLAAGSLRVVVHCN